MATDGHIESVHQVANGKIHAPLGHGRFSIMNVSIYAGTILICKVNTFFR